MRLCCVVCVVKGKCCWCVYLWVFSCTCECLPFSSPPPVCSDGLPTPHTLLQQSPVQQGADGVRGELSSTGSTSNTPAAPIHKLPEMVASLTAQVCCMWRRLPVGGVDGTAQYTMTYHTHTPPPMSDTTGERGSQH